MVVETTTRQNVRRWMMCSVYGSPVLPGGIEAGPALPSEKKSFPIQSRNQNRKNHPGRRSVPVWLALCSRCSLAIPLAPRGSSRVIARRRSLSLATPLAPCPGIIVTLATLLATSQARRIIVTLATPLPTCQHLTPRNGHGSANQWWSDLSPNSCSALLFKGATFLSLSPLGVSRKPSLGGCPWIAHPD